MSLSVTYTNDAFEKGESLDFYGVLLENGKAKSLSEEEETRLVQRLGADPTKAFKDSKMVKVSGTMAVKVNDVLPKDVSAASTSDHPNAPENIEGGES